MTTMKNRELIGSEEDGHANKTETDLNVSLQSIVRIISHYCDEKSF